ncbi:hypothetical protein V5O48_010214 [Marasmius crinis-equi]|uniref:CxC1-like cysteine cluster associated with KDZ transposases domain-containing protein n=1 Tax=Marasmius crinis-equi TaxID=585013 RepID=A0ABR3F8X7_9AGAR
MSRPRINKKKTSSSDTQDDYSLIPMKRLHPTAADPKTVPLLLLADGRIYTQDTTLPSKPGQVGLRHPILNTFPAFRSQSQASDTANEFVSDVRAEPDVYEHEEPVSAHRAKRNRQSLRWHDTVIPQLIQPYMELLRTTENLYQHPEPPKRRCVCSGKEERMLEITVVRFHRLSQLVITVCHCMPAALQLVQRGLFPSAPTHPTLAVDIRVLEFVKGLFLRVAPNHRAWCDTVTEFLGAQGYRMQGQDPLRRRFSNALQWFSSLKHATKSLVNQILSECRDMKPSESTEDHHPLPPDSSPPSSRPTSPLRSSSPQPSDTENDDISTPPEADEWARKRARVDDERLPPLDRPSEYLRSRCPLCFGGADFELNLDAIVCIDACFTQKHNRGMGKDPLKTHPDSVFMPEEEVDAMEETVESIRPRVEVQEVAEEDEDGYESSMRVPRSALDGCEASFTAADEQREKASTKFFDCTALMALLCRHDRVLWIANMTSAGERQHYVLALLNKLFQHLPEWFRIGLLYDIGVCGYYQRLYTLDCQVEHADKESLEGLGLWISRKRTDASGRQWVGERAMEDSGHTTEFLRSQWELQKKTQTQLLPKQSNQQGRKAVQEVLRLRKSLTILKGQKTDLEQAILDIDSEDWDDNVQKLPVVTKQITETEKQVQSLKQLSGCLGTP